MGNKRHTCNYVFTFYLSKCDIDKDNIFKDSWGKQTDFNAILLVYGIINHWDDLSDSLIIYFIQKYRIHMDTKGNIHAIELYLSEWAIAYAFFNIKPTNVPDQILSQSRPRLG